MSDLTSIVLLALLVVVVVALLWFTSRRPKQSDTEWLEEQ